MRGQWPRKLDTDSRIPECSRIGPPPTRGPDAVPVGWRTGLSWHGTNSPPLEWGCSPIRSGWFQRGTFKKTYNKWCQTEIHTGKKNLKTKILYYEKNTFLWFSHKKTGFFFACVSRAFVTFCTHRNPTSWLAKTNIYLYWKDLWLLTSVHIPVSKYNNGCYTRVNK